MFKPDQPFRKMTTYNGDFTVLPVTVTVLALQGEFDDGEPKWKVRFHESGKTYSVPECDLSPAPDAPALMSERFADLTDGFESPMVMAAAVEAICNYGKTISDNETQVLADMKGHMINGPAWVAAAKRAAELVYPK